MRFIRDAVQRRAPARSFARFSPKYSYSQRALVAVDLASRKLGAESFEIGLVRRGSRWLVSLGQPVGRITPSRS
jgi:hypothetical protein